MRISIKPIDELIALYIQSDNNATKLRLSMKIVDSIIHAVSNGNYTCHAGRQMRELEVDNTSDSINRQLYKACDYNKNYDHRSEGADAVVMLDNLIVECLRSDDESD